MTPYTNLVVDFHTLVWYTHLMSNKKWTEKEDNYLIEQCNNGKAVSSLTLEGRTPNAINSRVTLLKNRGLLNKAYKSKGWSMQEVKTLTDLKEKGVSFSEIAQILNRSKKSVECKYYHISQGKVTADSFGRAKVYNHTKDEMLAIVAKYRTRDNMSANRLETEPSTRTIERYFGSWSNATKLAGVESSSYGLKIDAPTILYLVDFYEFKKVGVTQRTVVQRFLGLEYKLLDQVTFDTLNEALEFEKEILSKVDLYDPGPSFVGRTECFKGDFVLLEDYL